MTQSTNPSKEDELDLLWKQFSVQVDLYKFFFDWILKVDIFYYSITGAMLSFYLNNPSEELRLSLLLPIALGVFLSCLFFSGRRGVKIAEREVEDIQGALPLKMKLDIKYLPRFLAANAVMCLLVAVVLGWLMCHKPLASSSHIKKEQHVPPNPGAAPDADRAPRSRHR